MRQIDRLLEDVKQAAAAYEKARFEEKATREELTRQQGFLADYLRHVADAISGLQDA